MTQPVKEVSSIIESVAREQGTVALAKFLVFLGVVVEATIPYPEALLEVAKFLQSWTPEKLQEAMEQTDGND